VEGHELLERNRPTTINAMALLNVAIGVAAGFVAFAATGAMPDFKDNLEAGSGLALIYFPFMDAEGRAPKLVLAFGFIAAVQVGLALIQYIGKGFGWTLQILASLFGIIVCVRYIIGEYNYFSENGSISLVWPLLLAIYITLFIIAITPTAQEFFGRFDERD